MNPQVIKNSLKFYHFCVNIFYYRCILKVCFIFNVMCKEKVCVYEYRNS